MRIRQGNDFIFLWAIERNELPEDFSNAENIRLHFKNFDCVGEVKSFQIIDGNIVRVEVSPEWASNFGAYRLILSYEFEDSSYSDGDRKCVVDVLAFNIVPKTCEADDITEMAKTTDIMIGLKGDKGDPFTYDDFTPEQIEDLKRPAIQAAESVLIVENQVSLNEQGRVQAENEREIAETTRVSNENNRVTAEEQRVISETTREQQEQARQANTAIAITNAENAIVDVNTAKDDYYDVVKPDIQAKGEYAQAQGDYAKAQGEAVDGRISEVEGKIGYSLGWYGIEFDETIANSACTRIGEMDLHRRLPIQNQMRRCLLLDNGKVNYYLHKDDSTKKADGTDAVLDGTDGQVMVEIPAHWRRFEKDGTVHRVKISDFKLEGFHFVPKAYRSAYEATVERSSLKLSSVVNMDVNFRGGNNNAALDGASNTLLGRPAIAISGTNFALYAKNRGDRWCMDVYHVKKAMDWLYYIEFANFNSQLPFNPVLTAEGFKQGGLGNGVTDLNSTKWSAFNGSYPFVPMGYTNSLGNKTGVKPFDMPVEYDENIFTTNVPSYRGVENPFGHIWKWADGLKINIQADDAGGESQMFVCEDPLLFQHSNYAGYEKRGLLPRANGYISKMIMGEFGELMPKEAVGGSTTYFADYFYTSIPNSGESQRGVLFGGHAAAGANAGLAYSFSYYAFSTTHSTFGSRLCFLP